MVREGVAAIREHGNGGEFDQVRVSRPFFLHSPAWHGKQSKWDGIAADSVAYSFSALAANMLCPS